MDEHHEDQLDELTEDQGGGLQSAIRGALTREGPQGPAHWAGEHGEAPRPPGV